MFKHGALISYTQKHLNETRKNRFVNVYKAAKLFATEMSLQIEEKPLNKYQVLKM